MSPSRLALASLGLTLLGIAVAVYMVYIHYQESALICGVGDCAKVQTSTYAEVAGIPIAWFGLIMYLVLLALWIGKRAIPAMTDLATVGIFGITLAGTLYVAYLTYLEIWVIEAICQWCVTFAIITTLLFLLSALQLWRLFIATSVPDEPS